MQTIPYSTQLIDDDDIARVAQALRSPLLTQGQAVEAFEQALADFLGVHYVVSFNSATSALYAAYRACFSQNALVITTPISFVATANMLLACGCEPIFADIGADGNITPESIMRIIEKVDSSDRDRLQGIVSVDFAGNSVKVDSLQAIAKEHNLRFIADSSHAFGGSVNGRKIGGFADVSIFSFHAIKPITTAEGGAISTNDKTVYEQAKLTRSHGLVKKRLWDTEVAQVGFNFRLNELQATLGLSQLGKIEQFLARREEIARIYDEAFADNPYFTPTHPIIPSNHTSTNHLYPILLDKDLYCAKEEIFAQALARGLGVQVHYKPIFLYELYANAKGLHKDSSGRDSRTNALDWYYAELSLPCHQAMSDEQVQYCIDTILDLCAKARKSC